MPSETAPTTIKLTLERFHRETALAWAAIACQCLLAGIYVHRLPSVEFAESSLLFVIACLSLSSIGLLWHRIAKDRAAASNTRRSLESRVDLADQDRRLAEAASANKSDCLAQLGHELRTPLTAIHGYVELLLNYQDSVERYSALSSIRSNAHHLLDLINDILDMSKAEAGRLDVERLPTDPLEIVNSVIESFAITLGDKPLSLRAEPLGNVPRTILTDPTRLRQILNNLVGNAVKFTASGSVRVVIETLPGDPHPRLSFSVIDTGIGIHSEVFGRLFVPYSQADASISRRFGDTGLGLVISRQLARLLGGDLVVSSQPGCGSVFRFTIDPGPMPEHPQREVIEEDAEMTAPAPAQSASFSKATLPDLSGVRVLVVEDGLDNQRLLNHFLLKAGATVVAVENGRLGVDATLRAQNDGTGFDIILMDLQMPILDGESATHELRSSGCSVPIVALTAHPLDEVRTRCLAAGFTGFVSKPFDRSQLLWTIANHSQKQSRRTSIERETLERLDALR